MQISSFHTLSKREIGSPLKKSGRGRAMNDLALSIGIICLLVLPIGLLIAALSMP